MTPTPLGFVNLGTHDNPHIVALHAIKRIESDHVAYDDGILWPGEHGPSIDQIVQRINRAQIDLARAGQHRATSTSGDRPLGHVPIDGHRRGQPAA